MTTERREQLARALFEEPPRLVLFVASEFLVVLAIAFAFAGSPIAWAYGALAAQYAWAWASQQQEEGRSNG